MTWMESCDPSLTHRKSHPVDYFKMVEAFNGNIHAQMGLIHLEAAIILYVQYRRTVVHVFLTKMMNKSR
jgi:hypothetical protein